VEEEARPAPEGWPANGAIEMEDICKEAPLFAPFYTKNAIMVPRQAREKHRERALKKEWRFIYKLGFDYQEGAPCALNGAKNGIFFECFPYVCPEPVLAKRTFLYTNGAK
jgi:hypothetical protein